MEGFCSSCGCKYDEGASYCSNCGVELSKKVCYIPDNGFVGNFLRYDNRLNRKRYIKRTLALLGVDFVIIFIVAAVLVIIDVGDVGDTILNWLAIAIISPNMFLSMRRFHDLNKPGWWVLVSVIPLVNVIAELYLLFAKGTDGANQYGPDPLKKN